MSIMGRPVYRLILHAGTTESRLPTTSQRSVIERTLKAIAERGEASLAAGARAIDVVEAVVTQLENEPAFNAGKGAVLSEAGPHELEAAIVDGFHGLYGAVACVAKVKSPVKAARKVMDTSRHSLLVGSAADEFAVAAGLECVPNDYFTTPARKDFWTSNRARKLPKGFDLETVGAVALDIHGNLAAAGSTGGLTGKMSGRVGDTSIFGAGIYADQDIAIVW